MRTTVELPADILREAKIRAASRRESLKSLLTRAVAAELGRPTEHSTGRQTRHRLPVFGNPAGPRVDPSNADLERALAQDDARVARAQRRRSR